LIAEDQPDYETLTVVRYDVPPFGVALLTRWTFTDEERAAIAEGEDIYLLCLTHGQPLQPLHMVVGPEEFIARTDAMAPPEIPVEVTCLHCEQTYMSDKMVLDKTAIGMSLWRCPTLGCDGAGYEHDVHRSDCPCVRKLRGKGNGKG
jgi:hypothetical protein